MDGKNSQNDFIKDDDLQIIGAINDVCAFVMQWQTKKIINENLNKLRPGAFVDCDKYVDFCEAKGVLVKIRMQTHNGSYLVCYRPEPHKALDTLWKILIDNDKYLKYKGLHLNNSLGFDYYFESMRESIYRYFHKKSLDNTYSYDLSEVSELVDAMFDDERYHGYLINYVKYYEDRLFNLFEYHHFALLKTPNLLAFRKVFIDNEFLLESRRNYYSELIVFFENLLPLKFEGFRFDNTDFKSLYVKALYYQYKGEYDYSLEIYETIQKKYCNGFLNIIYAMTYVIALYQSGSDSSLKKIEKYKKILEKYLPHALAANIVADFAIEKFVKNNFDTYKKYLALNNGNNLDKMLALIVLKQLGFESENYLDEDLAYSIYNEPYLRFLKFEMSACFNNFKSESEKMRAELGFNPLIISLNQKKDWEVMIEKLTAALDSDDDEENLPERRIIYVVKTNFDLVLYTQRRLKHGKFGKPIYVEYWKKGAVDEYMTELDKRIATHKRTNYRYDDRLYSPTVFNELLGTDVAYRMDDFSNLIPLKIEKAEPSIIVKKIDDKINIKTDFKLSEVGDGVVLNYDSTRTTIKVITLSKKQFEILKIINSSDVVPAEMEQTLSSIFQKVNERCKITLQSDLVQTDENIEKIDADSLITGVLQPIGESLHLKFFVKPFAKNPPYCEPGKGTATVIGVIDDKQVQAVRNLDVEKQNFNAITNLLKENFYIDYLDSVETNGLKDSLLLLELLQKNQDIIRTEWPEGYKFKLAGSADFSNLKMIVKSDNQWLGIEGELKVGEDLILKMSELLEKVRESKDQFIKLDDTTFLMLSEQLKKQLDVFASMANFERKKVKISAFEAFALEGFEVNGTEMQVDNFYRNILKKIKDADKQTFDIPKGLRAELRDYQEDGYRWMMRLNSWGAGACLADDMGLGKTIQAIAVMLKKADQGPSLVVCPASVLLNWRNELEKFAPSLTPLLIHNADKQRADKLAAATNHDIVLITYGILITEAAKLSEIQWNTIVLDEAHTIKNKETKMSKAAMNLKGDFKIILTGTPLQNHLGEIWNLFQFINPGLLGTFTHFTETYITPIVKEDNKLRQKQLKNRLLPFMLRRTKNEVLDELPEKTEIVLDVNMSDEETAVYENLRRIAIEKVSESENAGIQTLAEITRLRQAACNVQLVDSKLKIKSSKAEMFMELANELCGNQHRALVFSQFTSHLALIIKRLEEEKIKFLYLDGSTPVKEREKLVKTFQKSDDIPLFLISMKAGGLGLNLTAADYIIHLDPWWNPAVEDQASDRAYRIGQTRPVTVYRFISKNTIEEKIIRLHNTKKSLADALLDGSDMSHKLTKEEMLELLGVKK